MVYAGIKTFFLNLLVSGTASAVMKTIIAPLDRMKLILQNQNSALQVLKGELKPYKNIRDMMRRIPKEQGYLSFWRGNGTNLLRYIPNQALSFALYDVYKDTLTALGLASSETAHKFICGALAGGSAMAITYPIEFCQTRLATDMGAATTGSQSREFSGLRDCMTTIYNVNGIRGYYRGIHIQMFGICVYRSVYFGMYDSAKAVFMETSKNTSKTNTILIAMAIAQVVTMIAGLAAYPFDTVGRRLMLDSGRPPELMLFHNNGWAAAKSIYVTSGFRGFFPGGLMNCLRGIGSAGVLVIYDAVMLFTDWKNKLNPSKSYIFMHICVLCLFFFF